VVWCGVVGGGGAGDQLSGLARREVVGFEELREVRPLSTNQPSASANPPGAWYFSATDDRAGNRRFWPLSGPRAHAKPPWKPDLLWKMLRPLKRPGRARTVALPKAATNSSKSMTPETKASPVKLPS
jgi:hypothetical protein